MGLVHNTAYTTKVDDITDATLESCNIENGALARTSTGLYMGHNGSNVKIYPQEFSASDISGEDLTVNNFTITGGITRNVTTITSGRTLTASDNVVFTNFSTEQTVTLPSASENEGVEYIIRARTNTSKCVVSRSGSDKIDDGGLENTIDISADKSRTLISDGISTWYSTNDTGQ